MKKSKENEEVVIGDEMNAVQNEEVELVEEESRADNKVIKIKEKLKQCSAEKQEYLDGWQRAKADYVNAVRRLKEENQNATTTGLVKAVEAFLPALDSLERAKGVGELPPGFEAVTKQIENAFTTLDVSEVVAKVGEPFNPAYHEAFGQDKTDNVEQDGMISGVLEKGWQIGETVIRPTKVRVYHHK